MSKIFRLCVPIEIKLFLEFDGVQLAGPFGDILNEAIDYITSSTNASLRYRSKNDGIGDLNSSTGLYDGCVGQLQRNQSDLMLQFENYPPPQDTKQEIVFFTEYTQFLTVYYPRTVHEFNTIPIESCFKSFTPHVWITCAVFSFVVYSLILFKSTVIDSLGVKIRREGMKKSLRKKNFTSRMLKSMLERPPKRRKKLSQVTKRKKTFEFQRCLSELIQLLAHMTRLGSLNNTKGTFNKLIFIIASIFSLVIINYFSSYIKTELVATESPELYRSYKDLINNKIQIAFLQGLPHYKKFKFAPPGSPEKILWEISLSQYSSVFFSQDHLDSLGAGLTKYIDRKLVIITDSFWSAFVLKESCKFMAYEGEMKRLRTLANLPADSSPSHKSFLPFLLQDKNAQSTLKGLIFNTKFEGIIYDKIKVNIRKMIELGFIKKLIKKIDKINSVVSGEVEKSRKESTKYRLCIEKAIVTPEYELTGIRFENIRFFIIYLLFFLLFAKIVLICELCIVQMILLHRRWLRIKT